VVLVLFITSTIGWSALPELVRNLQYTYRLETYASLCIAGVVAVGLHAIAGAGPSRMRTPMVAAVALVCLVSGGLAVGQMWRQPSILASRDEVFAGKARTPNSWYARLDYADASAPIARVTLIGIPGLTKVNYPSTACSQRRPCFMAVPVLASRPRDHYTFHFKLPRAGAVLTNVVTGSYLVHVAGATEVGRTRDHRMVIGLDGRPGQDVRVSFSQAGSWPIRVGRVMSLASIAAFLALLLVLVLRRVKSRSGTEET
jgi:hypothetical protein